MFFGSGGIVTGLDVGATSVKVATLMHHAGAAKLVGLAMAEIAASGNRDEATAQAIKAALEKGGAGKNTPIVSAVGGHGVSVKHVRFPEMPRQTLAESIHWEARKHVPFGGSDFVLDFQLLDGANGDDNGELQVLLAAVETKLLDSHIEALGTAGVEPDTVDVTPLVLMNEIDEEGLLDGEAIAVIDLGISAITMSVYRRKGLFFARSIPLVARASEDDADGKKDQARGSTPSGEGWQRTVLREVRRSLAFYNNETGKQGIDRIYLTGARALAHGMAEKLRDELGIATEVLNPLENMGDIGVDIEELKSEGPRFAVALGLARRS